MKKQQEFKNTEIGKIPKEWKVVRLKETVDLLRNGLVTKQNKYKKGIPVTRIETISDERIDTQKIGYIEKISKEEISEYKLQKGDILFSHINSLAHIGKTAIYDGKPSLLLHGMNLFLLRPKRTIIKPFYLLYLLKYYRAKAIFRHISKKAVNQASINQTELGKLRVPLPPLPEQQKIAEILSTIDKAIERVDEAIAKTEQLKKGLMQELLTKGIGHNKFKDTEIGRIPKEWEVVRLGEVVKDILTGATPLRSNREYWLNGNIPWLTNEEVEDEKINYIWKTKEKVTEKALKETNIKLIPENSVILSLTASVGKVTINKIPITTNQQFNSFIIDFNEIYPEFLGYYFIFAKKRIEMLAGTTTFRFISKSKIANFKIPLPLFAEQKKIAEILSTVDKRLELLRNKKEKLERIKKGLMNDLLTGKRRVRV